MSIFCRVVANDNMNYETNFVDSLYSDLRIKDYLHLPAAFRSLSRLSSALSAKASTLRSSLLNLFDA